MQLDRPLVDSAGLRRGGSAAVGGGGNDGGDPGAGAFTYYHGVRSFATRAVPAGGELFTHYSDPYFLDRAEEFGTDMPVGEDYDDADAIVRTFLEHAGADGSTIGGDLLEEGTLQDLWDTLRGGFEGGDRLGRLHTALPRKLEDAGMAAGSPGGTAGLRLQNSVRPIEWLERNGRCADSVMPGPSAVPQAGRGGFATRSLPEGSVVAPLPLIPIRRDTLDMRDLKNDPDGGDRIWKSKDVVGKQLLVNYCFGHQNSSVLLWPYSSGSNWINHAPGDRANVELRWIVPREDDSDGGESQDLSSLHLPEWLEKNSTELFREMKVGLILELVATRAIDEGDEILLHYGDDWEQAWSEHVRNWVKGVDKGSFDEREKRSMTYRYPDEFNDDISTPIRTHTEQKEDPYPDNIVTSCFYTAPANDGVGKRTLVDATSNVMLVESEWQNQAHQLDKLTLRLCRILVRNQSGKYSVLVSSVDDDLPPNERHVVLNVPRKEIWFTNRRYSSDQHLSGAFRHEIGMPDELIPQAWQDLVERES